MEEQIDRTRDDNDLAGIIIYRVSLITDTSRPDIASTYSTLRNSTFRYPAHLPELPRRFQQQVAPPVNLEVDRDEYGNYIITWDDPAPDRDGNLPKYYTIYAARDGNVDLTDPRAEIAHRVTATAISTPTLSTKTWNLPSQPLTTPMSRASRRSRVTLSMRHSMPAITSSAIMPTISTSPLPRKL